MPLLSVIIPVFNEAKTIRSIIEKISAISIDKEIIVVDDGSSDQTPSIIKDIHVPNLKVIYHTSNRGKGAAFLTGLANAEGDYVVIQDADLEYDPNDYFKLLEAIKNKGVDVILGARFTQGYKGLFIPKLGNRFLTTFLNLLFGSHLNDCMTCYKLCRRQVLKDLGLSARSFDLEIEIVTKAIKNKLKVAEEAICYMPRTYAEGKKIRWKDGIAAVISIIKYRFC